MKRFLFQLLLFAFIPAVIIATNYLVDPAKLFDNTYETSMADYLVKGYNVTGIGNYKERVLQKVFINRMALCPTEIVLGSSTGFLINKPDTSGVRFINNSLSGGTLEDIIAVYSLYLKKGCKPGKIFLSLSPYIMNDNNDQSRWKDLKAEYVSFLPTLGIDPKIVNTGSTLDELIRYRQLISFSYFRNSVSTLLKDTDKDFTSTKNTTNPAMTKFANGANSYGVNYRSAAVGEVEERVKNAMAARPIFSFRNFTKLSESKKELFSRFVSYLKAQDIEVVVFLSPVHPMLYDYFTKTDYYHVIFEVEDYFRRYGRENNIDVLGSYNPVKVNLDNTYFYDAWHCTEKGINKIFSATDN